MDIKCSTVACKELEDILNQLLYIAFVGLVRRVYSQVVLERVRERTYGMFHYLKFLLQVSNIPFCFLIRKMQFSGYDKPWAAYTSLEQVLRGLINGGAHILKGLITGKEKAPIKATCIAELTKKKRFALIGF